MIGQAVEPATASGSDGDIRQLPFGQRYLGTGCLQGSIGLVNVFAAHTTGQLVELLAGPILLCQRPVAQGAGLVEIRRADQLLTHQSVDAHEVALALPDIGLGLVEIGTGGGNVLRSLAIGHAGEGCTSLRLPGTGTGQHRLLAAIVQPCQQCPLLHHAPLGHRQGPDNFAGGGGQQYPIPLQRTERRGRDLRLAVSRLNRPKGNRQ